MLSYVSIFDQLSAYDVSTKVLGSTPELYLPAELLFVQMNGVVLILSLDQLQAMCTYEPVR